jgi:hypothetical protein
MPRITNEEIADIRDYVTFNAHIDYQNNLYRILDRLAELEAEKHERRWRKISEEGLPEKEGDYEFSWKTKNSLSANKSYIDAYSLSTDDCGVRSWVDDRDSFDDETMKQSYVHWRPQLTDLPA